MTFFDWVGTAFLFWFLFVALPSFPAVRKVLAAPLVVTDNQARGDVAYLLAGGNSFRERLSAAVDLYHMKRVPKILFFADTSRSSYNFIAERNFTPAEWAVDFLLWRGVPKESIHILGNLPGGRFGTLAEANALSKVLPADVKKLVMVTSAAHTRRSLLTFRRNLPEAITVVPYAATPIENSLEIYRPLWQEYLKFLVYLVIA